MNNEMKEKLDLTIERKIDEIDAMGVDDERFKDACSGVNQLIESSEIPENQKTEKKKTILSTIGSIAGVVIPGIICLFAWNKSIDMDNEGVIQPNTARSVFKEFKPKK